MFGAGMDAPLVAGKLDCNGVVVALLHACL